MVKMGSIEKGEHLKLLRDKVTVGYTKTLLNRMVALSLLKA